MAEQNQAIGDANKQVVTVVKRAEQERDVAVTKANQELAVAKLRLEAAQKAGRRDVARGKAEANVILLNKQAEAEPLRQQVAAFGDGNAYAQYFFYQKVAPSVKIDPDEHGRPVRRHVQAVHAASAGARRRPRSPSGDRNP